LKSEVHYDCSWKTVTSLKLQPRLGGPCCALWGSTRNRAHFCARKLECILYGNVTVQNCMSALDSSCGDTQWSWIVGRSVVGQQYELGEITARGTYSRLVSARNLSTGEQVAIKILDKIGELTAAGDQVLRLS